MTEAEVRAYMIADNPLAEQAGWDRDILAIELQHLTTIDLDFNVTITGFEMAEIDLLIGELSVPGTAPADADPRHEVPIIDDSGPAITRPSDLWQIDRR